MFLGRGQGGGNVYGTIQGAMRATRVVDGDIGMTCVDSYRDRATMRQARGRLPSYVCIFAILMDNLRIYGCGYSYLFYVVTY